MNRAETLWACFAPVLLTYREWQEDRDHFVNGTDMDRYVAEMKAYYKVTPGEWEWILMLEERLKEEHVQRQGNRSLQQSAQRWLIG